jgi:hypothetical protein
MGEHTVCRIEESKRTQKPILQAINDIFNPWERAERMLQRNSEIIRLIPGFHSEIIHVSKADDI